MITDAQLVKVCADTYDPDQDWDHLWFAEEIYVCHRIVDGVDVIAFRGSVNREDVIDDLRGLPRWHNGIGFCHGGFLDGVDSVVESLERVGITKGYVITGHSLGAARALILGGLMVSRGHPPDLITVFGEPRPGFAKLSKVLLSGGFPIRSYKNRHDPVTDVPYFMGLYEHPTEAIKLNVVDTDLLSGIPDHDIKLYVKGVALLN